MKNIEKWHIASCSFGKDSLAMILRLIEENKPLDEVEINTEEWGEVKQEKKKRKYYADKDSFCKVTRICRYGGIGRRARFRIW